MSGDREGRGELRGLIEKGEVSGLGRGFYFGALAMAILDSGSGTAAATRV